MVVAIARLFESPLEEEFCLKMWIVFQMLLLHVNCMEIFFVIVYNSRNRILKFKVDQMINLLTTQPTLIAVWTNQKHRHMDTPPLGFHQWIKVYCKILSGFPAAC